MTIPVNPLSAQAHVIERIKFLLEVSSCQAVELSSSDIEIAQLRMRMAAHGGNIIAGIVFGFFTLVPSLCLFPVSSLPLYVAGATAAYVCYHAVQRRALLSILEKAEPAWNQDVVIRELASILPGFTEMYRDDPAKIDNELVVWVEALNEHHKTINKVSYNSLIYADDGNLVASTRQFICSVHKPKDLRKNQVHTLRAI